MRCAVYTRKSTEHNLDLAFNSLDAQRESCEAYVKSQAHEGWRLMADRYDDGGLSGASLERPALQQLLTDIRAGMVDIIVVYKVDRLTRSLSDFAKLVETFDLHKVAFVSVTQSFNTTSSMGRLTLNVLLSFAQLEREVIGERVRDKIAASKRKGLWVGGPVPLGYRSIGKVLVVVPADADVVRTIFERYIAVGSIGVLIDDLYRHGICPRSRTRSGGKQAGEIPARRDPGGARFRVGPLAHILKNRFYIGEIAFKGEIHAGQHTPILDRTLFDAVQAKLAEAAIDRRVCRGSTAHLLAGKLFDDRGHRMSPSHAQKRGVRYRYYVSQALLQHRKADAGTIPRISAPDIEVLVASAVRRHVIDAVAQDADDGAASRHQVMSDRDLTARHVQRVVVHANEIEIALIDQSEDPPGSARTTIPDCRRGEPGKPLDIHDDVTSSRIISIPWEPKAGILRKGIAAEPVGNHPLDPQARRAMLIAIGKARIWIGDLMSGRAASFAEIAQREAKGERHIRLLTPLAFLSPSIVAAIAEGYAPAGLTVSGLLRSLPHQWSEQERLFRITSTAN